MGQQQWEQSFVPEGVYAKSPPHASPRGYRGQKQNRQLKRSGCGVLVAGEPRAGRVGEECPACSIRRRRLSFPASSCALPPCIRAVSSLAHRAAFRTGAARPVARSVGRCVLWRFGQFNTASPMALGSTMLYFVSEWHQMVAPRGCGQARGARLFGGMQVEALRCTSNRERRWPENLAGMRTDRRGKVGAPIHRTRPWKERSNMSGSPWRARARAARGGAGAPPAKRSAGISQKILSLLMAATLATSMVPSAAWGGRRRCGRRRRVRRARSQRRGKGSRARAISESNPSRAPRTRVRARAPPLRVRALQVRARPRARRAPQVRPKAAPVRRAPRAKAKARRRAARRLRTATRRALPHPPAWEPPAIRPRLPRRRAPLPRACWRQV